MKTNSFGPRSAPSAARLALAAALLIPLLAACGAEAAGGSGGGGNGAEIPAPSPSAPSANPPYCGLKPEGQDQLTAEGMTFPATIDFVGKSLDDARALAVSRKLQLRVVGEDGVCNAITDDLSTGRINVYLEGGTVVAVGAF
jgi:hypothetical protein